MERGSNQGKTPRGVMQIIAWPLPIRQEEENEMETAEIMEALTLTDENVQELMEMKDKALADSDAGIEAISEIIELYDKMRGPGAFHALKPWEKLLTMYQLTYRAGYAEALLDVQIIQKLTNQAGA